MATTKSRHRTGVKPILKKLHSHSEKNSLDLDRRWEDPTIDMGHGPLDFYGLRDGDGVAGTGSGRVRDVSFSASANDLSSSKGGTPIISHHARSTSGNSYASIATTGSGRNGSFVHPFQQTPRTSTPPLSYANSLVSLENPAVTSREYTSAVITEDDSYDPLDHPTPTGAYTTKAPRTYHPTNPRRPSLASQRTSSLSDVNQHIRTFNSASSSNNPIISSSAARTASGGSAVRLNSHASGNQSHSESQIFSVSTNDSPLSATHSAGVISPTSTTSTVPGLSASASASLSMTSPLRSSLDMDGFRLRSRSDIDTASRQEQVRQARRRFEEKEKVKEEKYAREQYRRRERADTKEAHRIERAQAQMRKGSFGNNGLASGRTSSSTDARPSASRKSTGNRYDSSAEKLAFSSHGYDTVVPGQEPNARADDIHFEPSRRPKTAKRKTTSAWTAFVLWFRTRLLKLGRR